MTILTTSHGWISYPIAVGLFNFFGGITAVLTARLYTRYDPSLPWYEQARLLDPARWFVKGWATINLLFSIFCTGYLYSDSWRIPFALYIVLYNVFLFLSFAFTIWFLIRFIFRKKIPFIEIFLQHVWLILVCISATLSVFYLTSLTGSTAAFLVSVFGIYVLLIQFQFAFYVAQLVRLIKPAPERVRIIVAEVARELTLAEPAESYELKSIYANAYANPKRQSIIVTTRAQEILNDEELKQIVHHEYAHLVHDKKLHWIKSIPMFVFCGYFSLMFNFFESIPYFIVIAFSGFLVLLVVTVRLQNAYTRKIEKRADLTTRNNSQNGPLYGTALEKLYKENLIPAVGWRKKESHPDLYDRMVEAGTPPSFPRPFPPSVTLLRFGWIFIFMYYLFVGYLVYVVRPGI